MSNASKIIVALIASLSFLGFISHKSYRVVPGKQVGQFYINKTTLREVRQELGRGRMIERTWTAPNCNLIYIYHVLAYHEIGIYFTFYSEKVSVESKFQDIEIYRGYDAVIDYNISTYSTREDIYAAFGHSYSKEDTISQLAYSNLGITFRFADCVKPSDKDTLTSILIYKPNN